MYVKKKKKKKERSFYYKYMIKIANKSKEIISVTRVTDCIPECVNNPHFVEIAPLDSAASRNKVCCYRLLPHTVSNVRFRVPDKNRWSRPWERPGGRGNRKEKKILSFRHCFPRIGDDARSEDFFSKQLEADMNFSFSIRVLFVWLYRID